MTTREKILQSMYKLVAVHGYEKTALSMICKELNIKKPSIYYYFKSKEEMFIKVLEEIIFAKEVSDFDFGVKKMDYKSAIIKMGHDIIKSFESDPMLVAVTMEFYVQSRRINDLTEKIEDFENEYKKYVESILKHGVDIGALNDAFDVKSNTEVLLNVLQGFEFSIVFDVSMNYKKVWELTINRMFKEFEN